METRDSRVIALDNWVKANRGELFPALLLEHGPPPASANTNSFNDVERYSIRAQLWQMDLRVSIGEILPARLSAPFMTDTPPSYFHPASEVLKRFTVWLHEGDNND
jgi:hypothetical protein